MAHSVVTFKTTLRQNPFHTRNFFSKYYYYKSSDLSGNVTTVMIDGRNIFKNLH